MTLKARFIKEVGTRASLRVYWGKDCPSCIGGKNRGYHNAQIHLGDSPTIGDWKLGGEISDYQDNRWPKKCDHCDAVVPEEAERQVFRKRIYDTASGFPEPGDLYWADWYSKRDGPGCVFHDNCTGKHLRAILPNGLEWDIDGKASNCTMPKDRLHRCWVRKGEPPNVDVGKGGNTCAAGAGSIAVEGYHGFLRNGSFT